MAFGYGLVGLVLVVLAVLVFWLAIPRHGEVVAFLRGRENAQIMVTLAVIMLGAIGAVMMVFGATQ